MKKLMARKITMLIISASGISFLVIGALLIGLFGGGKATIARVCIGLAGVAIIVAFLAYLLRFVILNALEDLVDTSIHRMANKLKAISDGNFNTEMEFVSYPEFADVNAQIINIEKTVARNTKRISQILDTVDAPIGVYEYRADTDAVFVTKKLPKLLGIASSESEELFADKERFYSRLADLCVNPIFEGSNIYKLPIEMECYVRIERFMDDSSVFGTVIDVSEEIIEKQRLQHERDYDILTGIYGRRAFYRKVDELFENLADIKCAAMMMFDLNKLKSINDNYGHAGGDAAIIACGKLLEELTAPHRIVARLSGDEFAAFIYGMDSQEEIMVYINELQERMLQAEIEVVDTIIPVRMSGGYVFYPEYKVSRTKLLQLADEALYVSKKLQETRFVQYNEEVAAKVPQQ